MDAGWTQIRQVRKVNFRLGSVRVDITMRAKRKKKERKEVLIFWPLWRCRARNTVEASSRGRATKGGGQAEKQKSECRGRKGSSVRNNKDCWDKQEIVRSRGARIKERTSIMEGRATEQNHGLALPHWHCVPWLPAEVLQNCWIYNNHFLSL